MKKLFVITLICIMTTGIIAQDAVVGANQAPDLQKQIADLQKQIQTIGSQNQALINKLNATPTTKDQQNNNFKILQDTCHALGLRLAGVDINAETGTRTIRCSAP